MWYLIAQYNGKVYDLGAGLNQECCAEMMTCYRNHYDNKKVKLGMVRWEELKGHTRFSQEQFVRHYRQDHFLIAQIENYDVSPRYED